MKLVVLVLLALCALAHGRQLKQTTVAQALQAAQGTRVSTLLAAVQVGRGQGPAKHNATKCQCARASLWCSSSISIIAAAVCCYPLQAAGLTIPNDAAWTILAPTNEAFNNDDIREQTGLTAAQLLEPANKVALTQVRPQPHTHTHRMIVPILG